MYKVSIKPEEMEKLPLAGFQGEIQVIDKKGLKYLRALDYLNRQQVIGFDTETRPTFSPTHKSYGVSLLQLSGPDKAFLFRVKLLGMTPRLCRLLANEKIAKVGAATADDVRGLQRHAKFKPAAFIDLQKIVWEYGIKDKSVKKMACIILGFRISKTQQLSNWEAEELSEAQKRYAATDAWVCREMYLKLLASEKNPLDAEDLMPPPQPPQPAAEAKPETNGKNRPKKK
ncbi:MAG: 3'-5' exonuclease domain-containing protein 2 [Bacteroidales bacterium]|nr:3'-5' exonuclease domain-containing protein 2 [Bacteroidales bacterium]